MALRNFALSLFVLSLIVGSIASMVEEPMFKVGRNLEARLNGEEGSMVDCWNALLELKSCTNEIVLFFLNGDMTLGLECCKSVRVITRQCWPTMLTSLGFTAQEGDILRGYCDGELSAPPVGSVQGPVKAP